MQVQQSHCSFRSFLLPRWKRIPGRQFNFKPALDSAPTLDNYEGDFEGLFGNDGGASLLDDKFEDPDPEDHFSASMDQCARMCFAASGWFSIRTTFVFSGLFFG